MWELQQSMHSWIVPSLMAEAKKQDNPLEWLVDRFLDQIWESFKDETEAQLRKQELMEFYGDKPIYWGPLLEDIADRAIAHGSTTNGGHEVYLDEFTSIPWCDENTMLEWYS